VLLRLGQIAQLEKGVAQRQPQRRLHFRPAGEFRITVDLPRRLAQQFLDRDFLIAGVGIGVGLAQQVLGQECVNRLSFTSGRQRGVSLGGASPLLVKPPT